VPEVSPVTTIGEPVPDAVTGVAPPTGVAVTVPASTTAWYLRVRADTPYRTASLGSVNVPQRASRAALDADPTGLWLDDASRAAWVRFPAADAPQTVTLTR